MLVVRRPFLIQETVSGTGAGARIARGRCVASLKGCEAGWRGPKVRFSKNGACQRESLFVNQHALIFTKQRR